MNSTLSQQSSHTVKCCHTSPIIFFKVCYPTHKNCAIVLLEIKITRIKGLSLITRVQEYPRYKARCIHPFNRNSMRIGLSLDSVSVPIINMWKTFPFSLLIVVCLQNCATYFVYIAKIVPDYIKVGYLASASQAAKSSM